MIRTTLGALAAAEESVKTIAALKLPIKTAYAMSKLLAAITAELEHWHKQRIAWVQELGAPNDEGIVAVGPSGMPEFIARMTELASVAVEFSFAPVTFDMLGETEEMSARDIATLIGAGLLTDPDVAPVTGPHLVDTKKEPSDGERQLQPAGPRR
jgi:hypothetical protein